MGDNSSLSSTKLLSPIRGRTSIELPIFDGPVKHVFNVLRSKVFERGTQVKLDANLKESFDNINTSLLEAYWWISLCIIVSFINNSIALI